MTTFPKNSLVKVPFEFRQKSDNALADPTGTISFSWRVKPDGALTTYVFGTNGELVKAGTGQYYVNISLTLVGVYQAEAVATGTGQSAARIEIGSESILG